MKKIVVAAAAFLLLACGGPENLEPAVAAAPLVVTAPSDAKKAWAEKAAAIAAQHWGGSIDGWTLEMMDHEPRYGVGGLTFEDRKLMQVGEDEALHALPHEVGHAVIGDPKHLDPRWSRPFMQAIWDDISENVGTYPGN